MQCGGENKLNGDGDEAHPRHCAGDHARLRLICVPRLLLEPVAAHSSQSNAKLLANLHSSKPAVARWRLLMNGNNEGQHCAEEDWAQTEKVGTRARPDCSQ